MENNTDDDVICCHKCGKDTRSKTGLCYICRGTIASRFSNMRGEKCRTIDNFLQDEETEEETSFSRYHGDNIRDDT